MPKLSKPVQWTLIVAVFAVVVVYLLPNNTPATTSHPKARHAAQTADDDGISYEDLNAHFPRYKAAARDPFVPLVSEPSTAGAGAGSVSIGPTSGWALTGITTVDGVTNALVENSATNSSVFLRVGDDWLGMTVKSIDANGIMLVDAAGQPTRLSFVTTVPDKTTAANAAPAATPSVGSIAPLPPMPLAGNTRRGRRGRFQSNSAQPNAGQPTDDSSESNDQ